MSNESMSREEAADFLNVSRPYVDKLIDQGDLPYLLDIRNNQRRIPTEAVHEYKKKMKERQRLGIDQMIEASEELGLYDEQLPDFQSKQ